VEKQVLYFVDGMVGYFLKYLLSPFVFNPDNDLLPAIFGGIVAEQGSDGWHLLRLLW
jgi:hypothetical protein